MWRFLHCFTRKKTNGRSFFFFVMLPVVVVRLLLLSFPFLFPTLAIAGYVASMIRRLSPALANCQLRDVRLYTGGAMADVPEAEVAEVRWIVGKSGGGDSLSPPTFCVWVYCVLPFSFAICLFVCLFPCSFFAHSR